MRDLCLKCLRPKEACLCKYIKPVQTNVKFVFLMHPKEAKKQRTGTGRLASNSLPGSEILVGIDFTNNTRLNSLLNDAQYFPVLMYPEENALTAKSPELKSALKSASNKSGSKKLLVLIVDSTWFCSHKILKQSKNIMLLPKLSFYGTYKSIFTFKREPYEYCVSTIESCYYLIKELQQNDIESKECNPEPLMDIFKKMIRFQLEKENERIASGTIGTHAYDVKYTKIREIPEHLK